MQVLRYCLVAFWSLWCLSIVTNLVDGRAITIIPLLILLGCVSTILTLLDQGGWMIRLVSIVCCGPMIFISTIALTFCLFPEVRQLLYSASVGLFGASLGLFVFSFGFLFLTSNLSLFYLRKQKNNQLLLR